VGIKLFLTILKYFCLIIEGSGAGRMRTSYYWIRIRIQEAQKHMGYKSGPATLHLLFTFFVLKVVHRKMEFRHVCYECGKCFPYAKLLKMHKETRHSSGRWRTYLGVLTAQIVITDRRV
jgi:hypothetical protein